MIDGLAAVWLGVLRERLSQKNMEFVSKSEHEALSHAIRVLEERARKFDNTRKDDTP